MTSEYVLKVNKLREQWKTIKELKGWRYKILNQRHEAEIKLYNITKHLVYMEQEAFDWMIERCPDAIELF